MPSFTSPRYNSVSHLAFRRIWIIGLVLCLTGCVTSPRSITESLQFNGRFLIVSDPPAYEIRNYDWDFTNTSNPVILTKNYLNESLIGILRVAPSQTLPFGKTPVRVNMTEEEIGALMLENLHARGINQITQDNDVVIGGMKAVHFEYQYEESGKPYRGVGYGFQKEGSLFDIVFLAQTIQDYPSLRRDFDKIIASFKLIEKR